MRLLWFNLATDLDDPVLSFTTSWIREMARRVDSIRVITMRAGRVEVPANVRVVSVGKERGFSEPRRAAVFYRELLRILGEGKVDACFSHMIPVFTVLGAPVLRALRVPIVTWYAHRQVNALLRVAHHLSDRVASASESSYRYRRDRLVVLGHGIDTEFFSPDSTPPESSPLIVHVGRISPIKDLHTLIAALALLRSRGRTLRLALVGEAPDRDREYAASVRRRAEELGLAGAVEFAGSVASPLVLPWYARAAAHVNLCQTGALDKAVLEAFACARPSLAANEGFRETMGRWADDLLFRHGDHQDLAAKIEGLLDAGVSGRREMGDELRARVLERHALSGLADRLAGVLAGLARGRGRTS
ncbi:MAG: glycosyltransferase family 4 protein [Planctomycetes bacterium]|nr:glycosyltransferase family 4 protein [Planctomycetota bacterium]